MVPVSDFVIVDCCICVCMCVRGRGGSLTFVLGTDRIFEENFAFEWHCVFEYFIIYS